MPSPVHSAELPQLSLDRSRGDGPAHDGLSPAPPSTPVLHKPAAPSHRCLENEILVIDRFVSDDECRSILDELGAAFWQPSLTYQQQSDGKYRNVLTGMRVSETAHQEWFSRELRAILTRIEKRLTKLFAVEPGDMEPWQATDYCRDGLFDYHLDAGYWEGHHAGDRILTFLLYLTTPLQGGGTHFRALDRYVGAETGRLLVWNNLFANGDCNHRMIHSGTPVLEGRKITLVSWQRQKRYRNPA
jgi:prolyl 4-hydroxylase